MATHVKMPLERAGVVHHFTIGGRGPAGLSGYITVGLYPDGTLGEVFLTVHRVGGHERGMANTLAVMVSMSLQHGVPLKKIVDKLKGMRFEPQGKTENRAIPWCKSLADYLGQWLELKFAEQIEKETKNVGVQPDASGQSELENSGPGGTGQPEEDPGRGGPGPDLGGRGLGYPND
jgi:ribonucleoside-diphosphate reductase alpha chain